MGFCDVTSTQTYHQSNFFINVLNVCSCDVPLPNWLEGQLIITFCLASQSASGFVCVGDPWICEIIAYVSQMVSGPPVWLQDGGR